MNGNRDVLVLEFFRRLGAKADVLTTEVRDLQHRLTRAEHQIAASAAADAVHRAAATVRLDRLEAPLERTKRHQETPDRPVAE
jgi:hypothetical protein